MKRERRGDAAPSREGKNTYLYLAMGVGFLLAAMMVIRTAGVPAAGIGFVIPAAIFLGLGANEMQKGRRSLTKPVSKERELLSAIRDNGGSITPAEAAMETSLTVREADKMLSELAAGGHLAVESSNGTLFYALPRRNGSPHEIEG